MSNGPFPTRDNERNDYYNRTIPYVDAEKVRLTVDPARAAAVVASLAAWNTVYPDAKNPAVSTKTLRDQKDDLIVDIENQLRVIYNDIPDSLLNDADRNTLNLPKRDTITTPRPAIRIAPFAKASSLEGGLIEFICRTDSDSSRASVLSEADGVEMVYNVGGTSPVSPSECTKNFFSTKAKFSISIDIAEAGKKLNGFMRWKNNSDPAKSGPWTSISAMVND
ncbi:MAG: hypothetical protein ACHQNT_11145 [Bacteroidia bacterium]